MKKDYKEELTEKMHSEFTVSEETHKELKAGLVWESVPANATKSEIMKFAKMYGVSYEDCMKYRSEWLTAIRNSEDRYAK